MSFDPPGTWESGGDYRLYTMTNYLKAINQLIVYFGNRSTFVMGHSRGGSMAMLAGLKNERVRAFAAVMSWHSFGSEDMGKEIDKEWKRVGYKLEKRELPEDPATIKEIKLPWEFYEDQLHYQMTDELRECDKPKLFVAGKRDVTVKSEEVEYVYELSAEPKKLVMVDAGHDYRKDDRLIHEVNAIVEEFLDEIVDRFE